MADITPEVVKPAQEIIDPFRMTLESEDMKGTAADDVSRGRLATGTLI